MARTKIDKPTHGHQQKFDKEYVTVGEICETLNVNRSQVKYARETNILPFAISVSGTYIWRRDVIWLALEAWKQKLKGARCNDEY